MTVVVFTGEEKRLKAQQQAVGISFIVTTKRAGASPTDAPGESHSERARTGQTRRPGAARGRPAMTGRSGFATNGRNLRVGAEGVWPGVRVWSGTEYTVRGLVRFVARICTETFACEGARSLGPAVRRAPGRGVAGCWWCGTGSGPARPVGGGAWAGPSPAEVLFIFLRYDTDP